MLLLVGGCLLFVVFCLVVSLFPVWCFTSMCLSCVARCVMFVVCPMLFVAWCVLFEVVRLLCVCCCCLLFVVIYSVVPCLLFVVCSSLVVDDCWVWRVVRCVAYCLVFVGCWCFLFIGDCP